jgi:hypothetical protein
VNDGIIISGNYALHNKLLIGEKINPEGIFNLKINNYFQIEKIKKTPYKEINSVIKHLKSDGSVIFTDFIEDNGYIVFTETTKLYGSNFSGICAECFGYPGYTNSSDYSRPLVKLNVVNSYEKIHFDYNFNIKDIQSINVALHLSDKKRDVTVEMVEQDINVDSSSVLIRKTKGNGRGIKYNYYLLQDVNGKLSFKELEKGKKSSVNYLERDKNTLFQFSFTKKSTKISIIKKPFN